MKKLAKDYVDEIYNSLDHKYTKKITKKQIHSLINYFLFNIMTEIKHHNNIHLKGKFSMNIDATFIKTKGIRLSDILKKHRKRKD